LMQMILIMVSVKKGRGSIATLTETAVSRNTTRMTVRLPEIRSFWGILGERYRETEGERETERGRTREK